MNLDRSPTRRYPAFSRHFPPSDLSGNVGIVTGNVGKCREMSGNVGKLFTRELDGKCRGIDGKCRDVSGSVGMMTGNVGKCREMSGNVGKCQEMSGNCREMSGN